MAKVPGKQPSKPAPPSDPAAYFATQAKQALGSRLSECKEAYIPNSETPVLMAVLQNPSGAEKPRLEQLFEATDWRGDPPVLQVLDAATWNAMQALAATGMISIHTRSVRPLLSEDGAPLPPPLSPEQLAKIKALRQEAAKKRRAAEALLTAGLHEEAAPFKKAAQEAEAEAQQIENPQ
jgi:hypothetical protein